MVRKREMFLTVTRDEGLDRRLVEAVVLGTPVPHRTDWHETAVVTNSVGHFAASGEEPTLSFGLCPMSKGEVKDLIRHLQAWLDTGSLNLALPEAAELRRLRGAE